MSRRSMWNVPRVYEDDPPLREPQSNRSKTKPVRMPVRIGHGQAGVASGLSQNNLHRRTVGAGFLPFRLSPGTGARKMPQKVVKTPQGVRLVKNNAGREPILAQSTENRQIKSHPKLESCQLPVPANRQRALKYLDFNRQEGGAGLHAAPILRRVGNGFGKSNDSAARQIPSVNAIAETDLRRFALTQSSENNKKRRVEATFTSQQTAAAPTPESVAKTPWRRFGQINATIPLSPMLLLSTRKDTTKKAQANIQSAVLPAASTSRPTTANYESGKKQSALMHDNPGGLCDIFMNVEEMTEISRIMDISSYVTYQSQFVNNSNANSAKSTPVSSTGKKSQIADTCVSDQEQFFKNMYASQTVHTITETDSYSPLSIVPKHEPCTVTSHVALDEKVQLALNFDKFMTQMTELHANEIEQANITRKQLDLGKQLLRLQDKRVLMMQEFIKFHQTSSSVGRPVGSTVVETAVEAKPEEPVTPSRRRSARLARLSGITELETDDSASLAVLCSLPKETDICAVKSEATMKSLNASVCYAEHLNLSHAAGGAELTLNECDFDTTMPSPKMSAKPRRSIVNYRKLQCSFPGLMKTPKKTPVTKSAKKKMAEVLDTPADISRRVQASLELLHDE